MALLAGLGKILFIDYMEYPMPELLLKLKQVPEDEHEEILALLDEHNVEYYETTAGFWGIGLQGLWLRDTQRLAEVKTLLNEYQLARQVRVREEYQKTCEEGRQRTLWSTFSQQPLMFVLYLLLVVGLITITVSPFLALV